MEYRVEWGKRFPVLAVAGAAAALAVGLAVPWDGSEAHKGGHGHHGELTGHRAGTQHTTCEDRLSPVDEGRLGGPRRRTKDILHHGT